MPALPSSRQGVAIFVVMVGNDACICVFGGDIYIHIYIIIYIYVYITPETDRTTIYVFVFPS